MLSQKVKSDAYMGAYFGFILTAIASFYYDRLGAKAALHFQSSNYRFVPFAVVYGRFQFDRPTKKSSVHATRGDVVVRGIGERNQRLSGPAHQSIPFVWELKSLCLETSACPDITVPILMSRY